MIGVALDRPEYCALSAGGGGRPLDDPPQGVGSILAPRDKARSLIAKAEAALSPYGEQADDLRALARFVIDRHG